MTDNDFPRPYGLTPGEMALELAEEHYYGLTIAELMDMFDTEGMSVQEALDCAYSTIVDDYQNLDSDRILFLYRAMRARYDLKNVD